MYLPSVQPLAFQNIPQHHMAILGGAEQLRTVLQLMQFKRLEEHLRKEEQNGEISASYVAPSSEEL